MLDSVPGFLCGTTGSAGGTLAGFQRVAKRLGHPKPTSVQGKKGKGRAASLRAYTIMVKRESDGKFLAETIGPAYWSKKKWRDEARAVQARLIKKLN